MYAVVWRWRCPPKTLCAAFSDETWAPAKEHAGHRPGSKEHPAFFLGGGGGCGAAAAKSTATVSLPQDEANRWRVTNRKDDGFSIPVHAPHRRQDQRATFAVHGRNSLLQCNPKSIRIIERAIVVTRHMNSPLARTARVPPLPKRQKMPLSSPGAPMPHGRVHQNQNACRVRRCPLEGREIDRGGGRDARRIPMAPSWPSQTAGERERGIMGRLEP